MKEVFLLSLMLLALFTVEGESLSGVDCVDIVHSNSHTEEGSKLPKKVNDPLTNELIVSNDAAQKLIHKEQANIFEIIEESPKTFNVKSNAFKTQPVIGLKNYSDQQLQEIRERYINYRKNVTFTDTENDRLSIMITANDTPYDNDFESWNDRRLKDGLLCHDNVDCKWIDKKLRCNVDIELNFNASDSWFDGTTNSSIGVCSCSNAGYYIWSEYDIECWHPEPPATPPPWAIAIGVGILLLLILKLAIVGKLMV